MIDPVVQMIAVRWLMGIVIVFSMLVVLDMKRDWIASRGSYLP